MLGYVTQNMVGALAFVASIAFVIFALQTYIIKTTVTIETTQESIAAFDAVHILKGCIEQKGVISKASLSLLDRRVTECLTLPLSVTIRDLETQEVWHSGELKDGEAHSAPILLETNGKRTYGVLYVTL